MVKEYSSGSEGRQGLCMIRITSQRLLLLTMFFWSESNNFLSSFSFGLKWCTGHWLVTSPLLYLRSVGVWLVWEWDLRGSVILVGIWCACVWGGEERAFPRWWTVEKWKTDLLLVLIINHNYSLIGLFYWKIFWLYCPQCKGFDMHLPCVCFKFLIEFLVKFFYFFQRWTRTILQKGLLWSAPWMEVSSEVSSFGSRWGWPQCTSDGN